MEAFRRSLQIATRRTDILATLPRSGVPGHQHPGPQPVSKIVKDARTPRNAGSGLVVRR